MADTVAMDRPGHQALLTDSGPCTHDVLTTRMRVATHRQVDGARLLLQGTRRSHAGGGTVAITVGDRRLCRVLDLLGRVPGLLGVSRAPGIVQSRQAGATRPVP